MLQATQDLRTCRESNGVVLPKQAFKMSRAKEVGRRRKEEEES